MKFIILWGALLLFAPYSYGEVVVGGTPNGEYAPLSEPALQSYYKELDGTLQKAEARIRELTSAASSHEVAPTWSSKLELQNAAIQLEVKKTLIGNFKGTVSLRSPKVRERLLEVLNKPSISTGDLAELQSLVLEEKANIRNYDAKQ